MEKNQLKGIKEIFSEAGHLYTSRAIPVLLVLLLSLLISTILLVGGGITAFFALGGQPFFTGDLREILLNPRIIGTGALFAFVAVLLMIWCQAATLTMTVRQDIGILKGLITSWKYTFPLLWISTLYIGIIMAGSVFFIIPGLVLALSMSLCFFIMVEEERTGIDALLASRLYIRGHWWSTLLKLLPVWGLSFLIGLIPLAGPILSLLFTPFLMLYIVTVYHDLKECSGEIDPSSSAGWLWVLFGVFGVSLPLLAFIGSIVALGPQLPDIIKKVQTEVNRTLGTDIFPDEPQTDAKNIDYRAGKIPTVRQLPSVDGFLIWRDPIGDTHSHLLDIKEVSAKGDQGELILSVTTTRSLSSSFLAVKAGEFDSLISFYLDTDTNRATGGTPFGRQQGRRGYDLDVQVQLVAQQDVENKGVSGGVEVNLYQMDGEERRSWGTLESKAVTVSGDTVTIRLPYSQLETAPGDTVRICYREAAQEQGRGLAKDKLVPLK
ncbi:MAG: hypothetical protein WGN25_17310 [Candidatus Electrothrix sp. GW3-4]|uniref:hypothetical protein n=1 Tax=Candidatus Electrothrix sp. GW3-4 TaxID=3126740 RepID=UPI0030CA7CC9